MNCPFCAATAASVHEIAEHLRASHRDKPKSLSFLQAVIGNSEPPVPGYRVPCIEVDVDAIYRKRPDLIKPRSAP